MKSLLLLAIPLLFLACSGTPPLVERKFIEVYVPDGARWIDAEELVRAQEPRPGSVNGFTLALGTSDPVRFRLALEDGGVVTVIQPCFATIEAGDRWPSDAPACEPPPP